MHKCELNPKYGHSAVNGKAIGEKSWNWKVTGKCLGTVKGTLSGHIINTHSLTPWSRAPLEKLTGSAASQEIPSIFGTRRFLTVPTSARHLSLSWANSIQSPPPPPTSRRSILILSSHLRPGLPSGLFPSGLPIRTLCTPLNLYAVIYIYIYTSHAHTHTHTHTYSS